MQTKEEKEEHRQPVFENSFLQWSQWQLLDSILPTGGFAHSFGLEAAVQSRIVSDSNDLKTFLIHVLENTGSLFHPFVYSTCTSPNMENWHNLDRILDATLTNEVGRKASISQGSALMRVASAVFSELRSLKIMRDASLKLGTVTFHRTSSLSIVNRNPLHHPSPSSPSIPLSPTLLLNSHLTSLSLSATGST